MVKLHDVYDKSKSLNPISYVGEMSHIVPLYCHKSFFFNLWQLFIRSNLFKPPLGALTFLALTDVQHTQSAQLINFRLGPAAFICNKVFFTSHTRNNTIIVIKPSHANSFPMMGKKKPCSIVLLWCRIYDSDVDEFLDYCICVVR